MNAKAWFASQSFCGRSNPKFWICTGSYPGGGSYMCSLPSAEKAEEFRRTHEGYGHTVTVKECT